LPNFIWIPIRNASYTYNNIPVVSYDEPSQSSRDVILGIQKTEGLANFIETIKKLHPDIVHFQMISAGAGISLHHLEEVKKLGCKTILTMHLSHYTCLTNNLLQNNKELCDGIIQKQKCSVCYIHNKHISLPLARMISNISNLATAGFKQSAKLYNVPLLGVGLHVIKKLEQLKTITSHIDKICVITDWYKTILLRNNVPEEKIALIRQGVITSKSKNSDSLDDSDKRLKLIFIGRISALKGLHLLLQALAKISPDQYILNVYGLFEKTDPYFEKWHTFSTKHRMSVSFKGAINHHEINQALTKHDFLCLPSLFSEMSPLVIQEAFEAGIPVIGSNVPGITEEIKNEVNGFIFSFNQWKELQAIIKNMINHPEVAEKLKENVKSPRSFDFIGQETLDIYNNLLK